MRRIANPAIRAVSFKRVRCP